MKRKTAFIIALALIFAMCFSVPAYATVYRANPVISLTYGSISNGGNGDIYINFSLTTKNPCTKLGASDITLYKADGTFLKHYSSSAFAVMLTYDTFTYGNSLYYPGNVGESYYAVITYYAEYEGNGYSVTYTTDVGP